MSTGDEFIDLRGDGRIVLYKRRGLKSPKWQARIRVPNANRYKIVTTKTADLDQAKFFAFKLYEELYLKVLAGGSLTSKTFKQVFEEWSKALIAHGPTRQGGNWDATIERVRSYALSYFDKRQIADLSASDFADYWIWRKSNFTRKPPSAATLKREKVCLVPLMKFAKQRGYISEIPALDTPSVKAQRRSTFTASEWQTFYEQARAWVKEADKLATRRDRFLAQQYFLILANTGMRIGELRSLRWSDLRSINVDGTTQMVAWVQGKTGQREVVFQPGADLYVKRLYNQRVGELGEAPDRDGYVICHRDGSPVQSFKRSFMSLMVFAGLPLVRNGMTRTIYSLRHFYATQRLEHETSPFLLAKQMGTSVEMLEKFYGQTSVNASTVRNVSKGNQSGGDDKDRDYPFA